jgi:hypothetical protein
MSFRSDANGARASAALIGLLSLGFFALAAAVTAAHRAPATEFELSIYAGTPTLAWVGFGVALVVATLCAFLFPPGWFRRAAFSLGGATAVAITALPIIRDYWYIGQGDSLTHLGWVRSLIANVLSPLQLLYPGIHTEAVAINFLLGRESNWALMLVSVCAVATFVAFVPLIARELAPFDANRAALFAAVSAWFLLPFNHIAVHLMPHPSSQAIFLSVVPLYALVRYLKQPDDAFSGIGSPYGALLFLAGFGLILYHPMQALNFLAILGTLAVAQFVARRWRGGSALTAYTGLGAQTFGFGLALLAWVASRERVQDAAIGVFTGLSTPGGGTTAETTNWSSSLAQLGGSVPELFTKLFAVGLLFSLLTAGLVAWTWVTDSDPEEALISYLGLSLVPMTALFGLYFVGSSKLGFRQIGFMLVLGTIFGAIALSRIAGGLRSRVSLPGGRAVPAVVMILLLVLTVPVIFPSPYIFKGTQHVSAQTVAGYETSFHHRAGDMGYASVSGGSDRYADAVYGVDASLDARGPAVNPVSVTERNLTRVDHQFETTRYFVVTESARKLNVEVYNGFRYSERNFTSLRTQPGLDRVLSTGDFVLYVVDDDD